MFSHCEDDKTCITTLRCWLSTWRVDGPWFRLHRHHHVHVEQIVDVEVPQVREEVVHVPKIIPQERITQQLIEQIEEVPVPMTQEEIVHVPTFVDHLHHHHMQVHHFEK